MEPERPGPRSRGRPESIVERLRAGGPALVALSGGVDSAVVAHLARRALGTAATAVTLVGPSLPVDERREAEKVAGAAGLDWVPIAVDPLALAEYRANPSDRCYFCRRLETRAVRDWGEPRGFSQYLDGVHLDDLGEDRPGLRAMEEAGFRHPLVEAGWRKPDVRAYAREVGLPNWERPSNACLASRVPHGRPIERALLERIDRAEALLRARGFRRVRVRAEGDYGRVEVDPTELSRLLSRPERRAVDEELRRLGFAGARIDPAGYRSRSGG